MIFSKKFRKTAASILALVMVFAMSTGAFAYGGTGTKTDADSYYTVTVNYEVTDASALPEGAQISIIALEGCGDSTATSDAVKVTFDSDNTANNVLWIDQQAAAASGTFTFQVDAAKVTDNGFHVKSGVTGGETMFGYVTVASTGGDTGGDDEKSDDATLSAISVNGTAASITDETATATVSAAVTKDQITAIAAAGANYVVNSTADANVFEIVVTAEDGKTTKTYTLTVTVSGGSTGDEDDAPEVEQGDIAVGTTNNVFGVTDGKIVTLAGIDLESIPEGKTIAVDGEEAFYTSYEIDGETVIKFVTIITKENITPEDITYIEGEPTQLIYGDMDASGTVEIGDVNTLLSLYFKGALDANTFTQITGDVDGDGQVTISDVNSALSIYFKPTIIPGAATK